MAGTFKLLKHKIHGLRCRQFRNKQRTKHDVPQLQRQSSQILKVTIMQEIYFHPLYFEKLEELERTMPFQDEVVTYFTEFEGRLKKPDLYGKTLRLSERQMPELWAVVQKVSEKGKISPPPIYVYEDFYYGVEAKGALSPRLEISAKTIEDLSAEALEFLIAREICRIKWHMQKTALAMEQTLEMSNEKNLLTKLLPGTQTLSEGLRITYANWSRLSHYTADRFGYLVSRNISVCVRTILALVLNNIKLAGKVNVREYLKQMPDIYRLDDLVSRFSENDETIPYGPLRIKSLLAFASMEEVIHFRGF